MEHGRSPGISTRRTVWLVLSVVRGDHIPENELHDIIHMLIEVGWYCSTVLYTMIVRTLESME